MVCCFKKKFIVCRSLLKKVYFALMRKSDRDILDVFVKNRKEGVRMLFDRYYRPLVLYAGSLIDDDTMAEDLVQEFFVRLWEDDYLKHIEEKALSSYLFSSIAIVVTLTRTRRTCCVCEWITRLLM